MTGRVIIALTILAGIALIGVLGSNLNDTFLERVEEQRLQGAMGELRARLETDLQIGLVLADDERAQVMLEDAMTRTSMLDSIEVDSASGVVLFDSDRALRDQPVPPAWLRAMRVGPQGWRVVRRDEHTVGMPVRDAFGETVGYLIWTHREVRDGAVAWTLLVRTLWIAGCTAALALVIDGTVEYFVRSRRTADLLRLQASDDDVAHVLADAREEVARVDREAHHVSGIGA